MKSILVILVVLLSLSKQLPAQNRGGHHKAHPKRVVVVKRSAYRPHKVVVFHPTWRPAYTYHRRWVFFPKYNLYWDNWRNHYVFYSGGVWVSQPARPAIIVNVDLDKEKNAELNESDDDNDEIYANNEQHKSTIKPE